jgi:hypothetical protein
MTPGRPPDLGHIHRLNAMGDLNRALLPARLGRGSLNLNRSARSPRSMSRLRARCSVHV